MKQVKFIRTSDACQLAVHRQINFGRVPSTELYKSNRELFRHLYDEVANRSCFFHIYTAILDLHASFPHTIWVYVKIDHLMAVQMQQNNCYFLPQPSLCCLGIYSPLYVLFTFLWFPHFFFCFFVLPFWHFNCREKQSKS